MVLVFYWDNWSNKSDAQSITRGRLSTWFLLNKSKVKGAINLIRHVKISILLATACTAVHWCKKKYLDQDSINKIKVDMRFCQLHSYIVWDTMCIIFWQPNWDGSRHNLAMQYHLLRYLLYKEECVLKCWLISDSWPCINTVCTTNSEIKPPLLFTLKSF